MKGWESIVLITVMSLTGGSRLVEGPKPGGGPGWAQIAPARAAALRTRPRRESGPRRPGRRLPALSPAQLGPGVIYYRRALGRITAHVVQVDLNRAGVHVTVGVAHGGIGRCETWSRIINRLRPTAAITGTYYDPATFLPVGTIVADGAGIYQGTVGTALTLTADNQACLVRGRLPLSPRRLKMVLRAGPRLVDQGRVSLMPGTEGFRDPGILARKPRAAVGLTKRNRLLLVTVTKPLYLREMAQVMQALGAVNAMCMDGGSSTGLYYRGKSYQIPTRVMTNVLMVYASPHAVTPGEKA